MQLGRWIVAMAAWSWAAFGRDDALFLEIANHPGRDTDRLPGGANSREFIGLIVA